MNKDQQEIVAKIGLATLGGSDYNLALAALEIIERISEDSDFKKGQKNGIINASRYIRKTFDMYAPVEICITNITLE